MNLLDPEELRQLLPAGLTSDRQAAAKAVDPEHGPARSNLRYGYIVRPRA
jgi:hypothetical protein